jgi:hypothetical protein
MSRAVSICLFALLHEMWIDSVFVGLKAEGFAGLSAFPSADSQSDHQDHSSVAPDRLEPVAFRGSVHPGLAGVLARPDHPSSEIVDLQGQLLVPSLVAGQRAQGVRS